MLQLVSRTYYENKGFIIFIVATIIFRCSLADWNVVPTGSMVPNILAGDRIWVNKLAYDIKVPYTQIYLYRHHRPKRGDIVIFDSEKAGLRLVKRVIGLPNDTIEILDNILYINNLPADYQIISKDQVTSHRDPQGSVVYLQESIGEVSYPIRLQLAESSYLSNFGPVTVPENQYMVLGDNRDISMDSRYYGFIPREEIIGRAQNVIMSLDYSNYYLPRKERFFYHLP